VGALPAVFERLHKKLPKVSLHLTTILQNALHYRDLRERKIDLLFARITSQNQDDIHVERLFYDSVRIVAGPKSQWAHRRKSSCRN